MSAVRVLRALPGALLGATASYARIAWWGLVSPRVEREPMVLVQAVLLGERGVLLAERSDLRGWELPGGAREAGETDEGALRRELREEIGVEVEIERDVGEWVRSGFRPHTARIYRCRLLGEPRALGEETRSVRWFEPEAPPATLFPWYVEPLACALAPETAPLARRERQGWGAVAAGARIDLTMRLGLEPHGGPRR